MFNFRHKFSKSPKPTRFERILARLFDLPEVDAATHANLKKRILNRIVAESEEFRNAEILDKKLSGKKIKSSGWLDFLASIAEAILNLPKVLPHRGWRSSVREGFKPSRAPRFFGFLRQATAFTVLLIFAGGITLTTFISQTQTAAAQLSVSSGVVKIRAADSTFFEDVNKIATVRLGDTIRVEANSTAELSFYDASRMFLTSSTEVAITEFKPNFISRENSSLKVALLSGSVDAEVAKADSSFSVETPTGSVEATSAKFSVAVNPQTGSTKIQASEDTVAVKSTKNPESVALVAGESVVFADEPIIAVEEVAELPSLGKVQTDLELVKIWSFDALIAAQGGDNVIAKKTLASNRDKLAALIVAGGSDLMDGGELEALNIFIRKNYPDGPGRDIALQNLQQIGDVEEILGYYFVAPQKLRGVPEFEIIARDDYTPPGRLRNLFAVLRAGELAHPEVAPLVGNLSDKLITGLAADLQSADAAKQVDELLAAMGSQPIFKPVTQKLQALLDPGFTESITQATAAMEVRLSQYIGG
ncbi:MAG: FecR family protein [Candidatus Peribacteraceae bacterium]|nr:FecR family protein [Candidatus Peribacteraceae bacterium]